MDGAGMCPSVAVEIVEQDRIASTRRDGDAERGNFPCTRVAMSKWPC